MNIEYTFPKSEFIFSDPPLRSNRKVLRKNDEGHEKHPRTAQQQNAHTSRKLPKHANQRIYRTCFIRRKVFVVLTVSNTGSWSFTHAKSGLIDVLRASYQSPLFPPSLRIFLRDLVVGVSKRIPNCRTHVRLWIEARTAFPHFQARNERLQVRHIQTSTITYLFAVPCNKASAMYKI